MLPAGLKGTVMAGRQHRYGVQVVWTGNTGDGTAQYSTYARDHVMSVPGKPAIAGSSDPAFRGDATRWNPEELLVASLSACHKLWYLGLCAQAGVVVLAYEDRAEGSMEEQPDGAGQFTAVELHPHVTITATSDPAMATALHHKAHAMCFIARSMNFPVTVAPVLTVQDATPG